MHYYVDRNLIYQAFDTNKKAWHCGQSWGNGNLLSYEVCQSGGDGITGIGDTEFLKNEETVFKVVARDFKKYGITPSRSTIKLHRELSSTDCPWRSWQMHVGKNTADTTGNRQKLVDYFVDRVKAHMDTASGGNATRRVTARQARTMLAPMATNIATMPKATTNQSTSKTTPVIPDTFHDTKQVAVADTSVTPTSTGSVIGQKAYEFGLSFEKTSADRPVVYQFKAGRGDKNPFEQETVYLDNISFVWWCFKNVGIELGRSDSITAMSILNDLDLKTIRNYGQKDKATRDLLQVGDILSFGSNRSALGIYAGNDRVLLCTGKGDYDFSDTAGILLEPLTGYWWEQFNGIVKRVR